MMPGNCSAAPCPPQSLPCTDRSGHLGGWRHLGFNRHDVEVHQVVKGQEEQATICNNTAEGRDSEREMRFIIVNQRQISGACVCQS